MAIFAYPPDCILKIYVLHVSQGKTGPKPKIFYSYLKSIYKLNYNKCID